MKRKDENHHLISSEKFLELNMFAWRIPMDRGTWQAIYIPGNHRVRRDCAAKHTAHVSQKGGTELKRRY